MPIVNIIKSIGIYALTLVLVRIFLMFVLHETAGSISQYSYCIEGRVYLC